MLNGTCTEDRHDKLPAEVFGEGCEFVVGFDVVVDFSCYEVYTAGLEIVGGTGQRLADGLEQLRRQLTSMN